MHAHAVGAAACTTRYITRRRTHHGTNHRHEHHAAAQPLTYAFYALYTLGRSHRGKKHGMLDTRM